MHRVIVITGTFLIVLSLPACSQSRNKQIDFVGCPSDGQTGPIGPPQGAPKVVELDEVSPGQIAYYEGARAPGIFAPSGWHCRVWYGSSGSVFVVTSTPIAAPYFPPPRFRDKAVEVSNVVGEGSGRFSVATYASWLFPGKSEKFVQHVKDESAKLPSPFWRAPYPGDFITTQGSVAEFMTPAEQKGVGTEGYLDPSQDGIRGIAVLDEADPECPAYRSCGRGWDPIQNWKLRSSD